MSGKTWRRLWHLVGGSLAPIGAFFISEKTLLITLSAVTFAFLVLELIRFLFPKVNDRFFRLFQRVLKKEERSRPIGSSYLLVASVLAFLLFEKDIAIACLLFLAVGDPAAGVIGERLEIRRAFGWGWRGWGWPGAVACLLSCLAVGMVLIQVGLNINLILISVGAAVAAVVALFPWPIDDNIVMPLLCGAAMTLIAVYCG